jgi:hypothetical protein
MALQETEKGSSSELGERPGTLLEKKELAAGESAIAGKVPN